MVESDQLWDVSPGILRGMKLTRSEEIRRYIDVSTSPIQSRKIAASEPLVLDALSHRHSVKVMVSSSTIHLPAVETVPQSGPVRLSDDARRAKCPSHLAIG